MSSIEQAATTTTDTDTAFQCNIYVKNPSRVKPTSITTFAGISQLSASPANFAIKLSRQKDT